MSKRIGSYVTKKESGEPFKAYVPPLLPLDPPIELDKLSGLLEKAACALSELNNTSKSIPNTSLFIYMYVRKEALLSSQIEGTQSSLSDLILFENHEKPKVSLDDVEEVSNYVKAIYYGLERLRDDLPLSLRLIRGMHSILLSGTRGDGQLPGEFRTSQNWIGGTRPGNALFVPPPVDKLADCLSNLEKFLHNKTLPVLIKAAIAHVQFETVHPFLDGNGRLGRLLITLLLVEGGLIDEPVLYLSLYLKQNRDTYYNLLQEVRTHGRWEVWIEFFLEGILVSSKEAIKMAQDINRVFAEDKLKIETLGRGRFSCEQALEYLKRLPQVSASLLAKQLSVSMPTARGIISHMVDLEILEEISGKQRDKVYVYKRYLKILERDAKPF